MPNETIATFDSLPDEIHVQIADEVRSTGLGNLVSLSQTSRRYRRIASGTRDQDYDAEAKPLQILAERLHDETITRERAKEWVNWPRIAHSVGPTFKFQPPPKRRDFFETLWSIGRSERLAAAAEMMPRQDEFNPRDLTKLRSEAIDTFFEKPGEDTEQIYDFHNSARILTFGIHYFTCEQKNLFEINWRQLSDDDSRRRIFERELGPAQGEIDSDTEADERATERRLARLSRNSPGKLAVSLEHALRMRRGHQKNYTDLTVEMVGQCIEKKYKRLLDARERGQEGRG